MNGRLRAVASAVHSPTSVAGRGREPGERDHQQAAHRRDAPLPQRRRHDDPLAHVLQADGDRQQQAEVRRAGDGEAGADGQPLGDAVQGERADHGVGAARLAIVPIVPRLVAQVLMVPAGVPVGDQAIHRRRQADAGAEAHQHPEQARRVESAVDAQVAQRLAQQAERRRCQHQARPQTQDPVVKAARQLAHEGEGHGAEHGRKTGRHGGEQRGAHDDFLH